MEWVALKKGGDGRDGGDGEERIFFKGKKIEEGLRRGGGSVGR